MNMTAIGFAALLEVADHFMICALRGDCQMRWSVRSADQHGWRSSGHRQWADHRAH